MKVNAGNIEEWIFDFHEGMLSEEEQSELMNFLHNHPEYNESFVRGVQAQALKHEAVPIPADLLHGVLQPAPIPFWANKFLLGTISGVVLSGLVAWFVWTRHDRGGNQGREEDSVPSVSVPLMPENIREGKETRLERIVSPTLESHSVSSSMAKESKEEAVEEEITQVLTVDSSARGHKLEVPMPSIPHESTASDSVSITLPDKVPVESEAITTQEKAPKEKSEQPAVVFKKKRNALPFNMKPQSKFKPANPNF